MRGNRRPGRFDSISLVIAAIGLLLIALDLLKDHSAGLVARFDYAFGIVTVCLAAQGGFVLWSVRKDGKVPGRIVLAIFLLGVLVAWGVAMAAIYSGWPMNVDLFNQWNVTKEAISSDPYLIGLVLGIVLGVATLWYLAFVGGVWLLTRVVQLFMPNYLMDVKSVKFDGKDGLVKWVECWIISFPNMLEPSSLRLDRSDMDDKGVVTLFKETVLWQIVLGLLLAIYISFNPMLLSAFSFNETIQLIYIPIGILPLFILPWAILDGLGAKVSGTRRDFYLHEGARKRMIQTLITFGTLLLILRLAVIQIGIGTVIVNFIVVAMLLLILSVMASFIYFNYFAETLLKDLKARMIKKGF